MWEFDRRDSCDGDAVLCSAASLSKRRDKYWKNEYVFLFEQLAVRPSGYEDQSWGSEDSSQGLKEVTKVDVALFLTTRTLGTPNKYKYRSPRSEGFAVLRALSHCYLFVHRQIDTKQNKIRAGNHNLHLSFYDALSGSTSAISSYSLFLL